MTGDSDDRNPTQERLLAELARLQAELAKQQRRSAEREAEHNHVEAALRRSQILIKRMISRLPQILYVAHPKTYRLLYVNDQFTRILGYSREELPAGSREALTAILHPDDQAILHQNADRWASVSDDQVIEFEYRAKHANGSWRWLQSREVVFARDASGQPMQVYGTAFDITDRKQAEAELRQSQQFIEKLTDSLPQLVFIYEFASRRILYINRQSSEMLGYQPEDLLQVERQVLSETFHPDDLPLIRTQLARIANASDGEVIEFEYRRQHADGSWRWRQSRQVVFRRDRDGRPAQILGTSIDITDTKHLEERNQQAQEAIRRSEARYSLATGTARVGVWEWNLHTGEYYLDAKIKALLGYSDAEIPNDVHTWSTYCHPDDKPLIAAATRGHLQQRTPEFVVEHRALHKDGSIRWLMVRGATVWDDQGKPLRGLGTATDITDRKLAEEALRQNEAQFRRLAEGMPGTLYQYVIDREGGDRFTYMSPRCLELFGVEAEAVMQDTRLIQQLFHPEDVPVIQAAAARSAEQLQPFWVEHRIILPSGQIKWLQVSSRPEQQPNGDIVWDGLIIDITDRKQAEADRRKSEEKFTKIFGSTPDPVSITTLAEGILLEANESLYQISGYQPEELLGRSLLNDVALWLHPDHRASFVSSLQEQGSVRNFELSFRTKSGDIATVLTSAELIELEGQRCILAVHKDITDRKRAEAELRQSEQKFRQLVENIRDVFFICAPDHSQIHYISPAYEAIWGRSCDSLYQQPYSWLESIHPEDRDRVCSHAQQVPDPGGQSIEYRIIRPDGLIRWLLCRTFPIVDQPGQVSGVAGIVKDITDRKQIEAELNRYRDQLETLVVERTTELKQTNQQLQQELQQRKQTEATLREAESRWRTLLEDVPLLVMGLDTEDNITYVNPFLLQVTGYTQNEVLNKNYFELFQPIYQSQESSCTAPIDIRTKTGEIRKIACNSTVLRNSQGDQIGMLAIAKDITEQYLLDRMKEEFISIVSHELRTPLTPIQGALDLLADGLVDLHSDQARHVVAIAADAAERLVRLVDNILDLERLESGKVELVQQFYDMAELMLKAADLMQLVANGAGITISVAPLPIQLQVDGDRILQLLTNLLSNAIKFSSSGSTVWLSAELVTADDSAVPRYARFSVRDEGRGIPPDKLGTIFERFQQVDASDARQRGGTGLGLAICRSIVQQHGGKIWAESTLGAGSCFYFTLPFAAGAPIQREELL